MMTKKRWDRDKKWGFQGFPYYQLRVDNDLFHGLVSLIELIDGDTLYWNLPKAGKVAVAGKGMKWLQLIPDNTKRAITAKFLPDESVSVWYIDVIECTDYDVDGVVTFTDQYLDVIATTAGDVIIDDQDELDEAFKSGELTKKQYEDALLEGDRIVKELCTDLYATERWCKDILDYVKKQIDEGLAQFKK